MNAKLALWWFLSLAALGCAAEPIGQSSSALTAERPYCQSDADCAPGLLCEEFPMFDHFGQTHVCAPHVSTCVGNPCGDDGECMISDHVAEGGLVTKVFYCVPRLEPGETCLPLWDRDQTSCGHGLRCVFHWWNQESWCDVGHQLDEECSERDDCAAGLYCDWSRGTCQPVVAEGEPCFFDECGPGLTCDPTADGYRCMRRHAAGGQCHNLNRDGAECATGLLCELPAPLAASGVCVDPSAPRS